MADLLFDTPWWLPTLIAIVGGWMLFDGNKRGADALRNAGAAVVLAALLLVAVSYFVSTDKETVLDRTSALISSIEKQDWATFESLLDEKTSMAGYAGRAQLVAGAKASSAKFGLKKAYVTSKSARQDDTLITVTISAMSEQDLPPYPLQSQWELDWQQRGDRWLLYRITPLSVGGQPGESVGGHLPSVSR
jgi:hypothetical protein